MNGARNRRHGHDSERLVVGWLRARGYPDVKTTRELLGHDGSRQPGDVAWRDDVLLEVKSRISSSWPAWIAKARSEALPGQRWIVVRRIAGNRDVSMWPAATGTNGDGPAFRHPFITVVHLVEAAA